jgi:hypothetical protein
MLRDARSEQRMMTIMTPDEQAAVAALNKLDAFLCTGPILELACALITRLADADSDSLLDFAAAVGEEAHVRLQTCDGLAAMDEPDGLLRWSGEVTELFSALARGIGEGTLERL